MKFPRLTRTKLFLLLGLLIITVAGVFLLFRATTKNIQQSTPSKTLTNQRQQILTEIQSKLTTKNLDENKLCQKLKEKHPTIANLNSYLQNAKSIEQLNILYQEIQNTITLLTQSPPNPPASGAYG